MSLISPGGIWSQPSPCFRKAVILNLCLYLLLFLLWKPISHSPAVFREKYIKPWKTSFTDSDEQQKNIDDLAGAASTLIEAKGERNKAKAPADELQQLERQRKILEEKKKIRDLEKDLDEDDRLSCRFSLHR